MINANDMQSWAYLLAPTFQFVNTAGKPLTEGWIEVYIAGTRNKYYCASDFNGTLHPFQIPLDSLGANIVLADPDQGVRRLAGEEELRQGQHGRCAHDVCHR